MRFFRHISRPTVASSRILTVHYPVALDVCIYTQSINTEGIKFSSFSSFFYSFLRTSFRQVGGIYNKVSFKVSRAVYISVTPYKKDSYFEQIWHSYCDSRSPWCRDGTHSRTFKVFFVFF